MRFTILSFICLIFSFQVIAQSESTKHYGINIHADWLHVKEANQLLEQHSYYNAIDKLKDVLDRNPDNTYVSYRLGLGYYYARDYKNAEKHLEKAISAKDNEFPLSWYYYGATLKSLGKYSQAQGAFQKYQKQTLNDAEEKRLLRFAKNEVLSCDYAMKLVQEDSAYSEIKHLENGINHAYSDFSPRLSGSDTMLFSSLRVDTVLKYSSENDEAFFPVKIYRATKQANDWTDPQEVSGVNTALEHTANGTYSEDGNRFYFTRCYLDRHNKVICSIYFKEKENGVWGNPQKMHHKINVHGYTSSQPTFVSKSKKVKKDTVTSTYMYFVSDRPGGQGGMDIWYSKMNEKGVFSTPENCGNRINTMGDEVSPYYDIDNKILYLSSNFHHGLGGYDVFKTTGEEKRWSKPENIGMPYNTSYDDTYFAAYSKQGDPFKNGFLVTNRPGGIALKSETCCDDIYSFKDFAPPMLDLAGSLTYTVCDTVADSLVSIPLNNTKIGIIRQKHVTGTDSKSYAAWKSKIVWVDTTQANGSYSFRVEKDKKYTVVLLKESFFPNIITLDSFMRLTAETPVCLKRITAEQMAIITKEAEKVKVEHREKINLDIKTEELAEDMKFVLENVLYETNSAELTEDSKESINLLFDFLTKHPDIKVEISGHTDSQGSDKFNQSLSERRARSVVRYLVEKGVNAKRLVAKGYGETQPIAANENADGSDNPEGRRLNRRTEVKILSKMAKGKVTVKDLKEKKK